MVVVAALLVLAQETTSTIQWQGTAWNVRSAANEGPGPNRWDPKNVWLDAKGDLHLRIAIHDGVWSCAELWTDRPLGFGAYQCQVEGRLDRLDPNVVFSMFSYQGPDGTKEIDIEYAKWGDAKAHNLWWTVWPETAEGKKSDNAMDFGQPGADTTSRYVWKPDSVHYWTLAGFQPLGALADPVGEFDDHPVNPTRSVPQHPMPLHFNLWLVDGKPPTDGKPVEIVVHRFAFKPLS